jgi:hypothetical protein
MLLAGALFSVWAFAYLSKIAWKALRSGRAELARGFHLRKDEPLKYWVAVCVQSLWALFFAAILLGLAIELATGDCCGFLAPNV